VERYTDDRAVICYRLNMAHEVASTILGPSKMRKIKNILKNSSLLVVSAGIKENGVCFKVFMVMQYIIMLCLMYVMCLLKLIFLFLYALVPVPGRFHVHSNPSMVACINFNPYSHDPKDIIAP